MKRLAILLLALMLFGSTARAETATASLQEMYAQAELLMVQGDYAGAAAKFEALSAYSDAAQMTLYCKAIYAADMGMYVMAVDALSSMGQFKDAPQLARYYTACSFLNCAETGNAMQMVDYEKYMQLWSESLIQSIKDPSYEIESWDLVCCYWAKAIFTELALYKDSMMKAAACDTLIQQKIEAKAATEEAEKEKKYQEALAKEHAGDYQTAANLYSILRNYKDSAERYISCLIALEEAEAAAKAAQIERKYQEAISLVQAEKYWSAIQSLDGIHPYKDSQELIDSSVKAIQDLPYVVAQIKTGDSVSTYSYDDNGHLLSMNEVDGKGYSATTTYEYDANGNIIKGIRISENKTISLDKQTTILTYNSHGDVISAGHTMNEYTYGEFGEMLSHRVGRGANFLYGTYSTFTYEYFYGIPIQQVTHGDSGIVCVTTYTYDECGNLIMENSEYPSSNATTTTSYTYTKIE